MSYFEFPHTRNYDSDLGWLIKMMKELISKAEENNKSMKDFVDEWLEEHPEATTTVQDGSIGLDQLANESKAAAGLKYKAICHRGYTVNNPYAQDNSIFAIINAAVNGFAGCELDPRKDETGEIVLLHDEDVSSVSFSTGKIQELNYKDVTYMTKAGDFTSVPITTLKLAITAAKAFNLFFLFDMGKNIVSCKELADVCEKAGYYNYGVFNVSDYNQIFDLPDYVVKLVGNDIFVHTEEELDEYKRLYDGVKNLGVRVILSSNLSAASLDMIHTKGFIIAANYADNNFSASTTDNIELIDFILGDDLPTNRAANYAMGTVNVLSTYKSPTEYYESLGFNTFNVFQTIGSDWTPTTANYTCLCVKYSQLYGCLFAINNSGDFYFRYFFNGSWQAWIKIYPVDAERTTITYIQSTEDIATIYDNMPDRSKKTLQVLSGNSFNPTTGNHLIELYRLSAAFGDAFAVNLNDLKRYGRKRSLGNWENWIEY